MVGITFFAARMLSPNNPNPEKLTSYECGEEPTGSAWMPFNTRFYVIALIFLLFDVEMIFVIPWATVFGNRYGTPRPLVEATLHEGRDVLFDIDWQGTQQLQQTDAASDLVRVFILPPTLAELERRLRGRGTDSDPVIAERMRRAKDEISHWGEYNYILVNDDPVVCLGEIRAILAAERLRRKRQLGLANFVRDMLS